MAKHTRKSKQDEKVRAPEPTLREVITPYVVTQTTVIMEALPRLRDRQRHSESATAVRRLRAVLRAAEELLDIPRSGRFDDDLGWYAGPLDRLVDLDLASDRVAAAIEGQPVELMVGPISNQLATALQTERQLHWRRLHEELDAQRIHQLLAQLHTWRSDTPFTAEADRPAKKITGLRKRAAERLDRRLDTARAALAHDPHAAEPGTRSALDRAQAAEQRLAALDAMIGRVDADAGGPLEDHRRSRLTADVLRHEGIRLGVREGHNGFSYGLLYALERQHQRDLAARI